MGSDKGQEEDDGNTLDVLAREHKIRKNLHKKIEKRSLPEALAVSAGGEANEKLIELCNDFREYLDSLDSSQELNERLTASSISLMEGIVEDNKAALEELTNAVDNLNSLKSSPHFQISHAKARVRDLNMKQVRLSKLKDLMQKLISSHMENIENKNSNREGS